MQKNKEKDEFLEKAIKALKEYAKVPSEQRWKEMIEAGIINSDGTLKK